MKTPTKPTMIRVRSWTTTTKIPVFAYVHQVKYKLVKIPVKVTDSDGTEHMETVTLSREVKVRKGNAG